MRLRHWPAWSVVNVFSGYASSSKIDFDRWNHTLYETESYRTKTFEKRREKKTIIADVTLKGRKHAKINFKKWKTLYLVTSTVQKASPWRNETKYVIYKKERRYISVIWKSIISPAKFGLFLCLLFHRHSAFYFLQSRLQLSVIFIRVRNTTTIRYMMILVGSRFFFAIVVGIALATVFVQTAVSV